MRPEPVNLQYRGGWTLEHTLVLGDWARVAVKGEKRIHQGGRSVHELLDCLDRLDGRGCFTDFIAGIRDGLTKDEASVPLAFGPDGDALPRGSAPAPVATVATPVQAAGVPVQLSLFGDEAW